MLLFDCLFLLDVFGFFFLLLAINPSWHSMQNIPCDVRAYRRFSIFFLQLRQRKQLAQNAWSPVRIARSSILFPQALQLYVQLLQMRDPSPRRRRFASESRRVLQVLQRKQSICHRLPAWNWSDNDFRIDDGSIPYLIQRLFPPLESIDTQPTSAPKCFP